MPNQANQTRHIIPFGGMPTGATAPPEPPPVSAACGRVLPIFRRIAREFAHLPDDYICEWVPLAQRMTSRRVFRALWLDGVAYLTAHFIWMAFEAERQADGVWPLTNISEDGGSEGYQLPSINYDGGLAAIKESPYGRTWASMRQPFISV